MSPVERTAADQEVKLLASLHHPNIVSYHESFIDKSSLELCIVMTFCEGGDLYNRIKEQKGQYFPEKQIVEWFVQLCLALKCIHDRRVLHRDLKTQNVFLTKNNIVKLGDFGVARVLNEQSMMANTMIGTPYYLSPELCENKPYDYKSDIWSLGCVLYEMTTLNHAFDAKDMCALVMKIIKGQYPPIPDHYSSDLRNLISAMLAKDASQRPDIMAILQLPFIMSSMRAFLLSSAAQQQRSEPTSASPSRSRSGSGNLKTYTPTTQLRSLEAYDAALQEMEEQLMMVNAERSKVEEMLERSAREHEETLARMSATRQEKIRVNMEQRRREKEDERAAQMRASEEVRRRREEKMSSTVKRAQSADTSSHSHSSGFSMSGASVMLTPRGSTPRIEEDTSSYDRKQAEADALHMQQRSFIQQRAQRTVAMGSKWRPISADVVRPKSDRDSPPISAPSSPVHRTVRIPVTNVRPKSAYPARTEPHTPITPKTPTLSTPTFARPAPRPPSARTRTTSTPTISVPSLSLKKSPMGMRTPGSASSGGSPKSNGSPSRKTVPPSPETPSRDLFPTPPESPLLVSTLVGKMPSPRLDGTILHRPSGKPPTTPRTQSTTPQSIEDEDYPVMELEISEDEEQLPEETLEYQEQLRAKDSQIADLQRRIEIAQNEAIYAEKEEAGRQDYEELVENLKQTMEPPQSPRTPRLTPRAPIAPVPVVSAPSPVPVSLAETCKMLRDRCAQALGVEQFGRLYHFMKQFRESEPDGKKTFAAVKERFGLDAANLAQFVSQLIFCESFLKK